MSQTTIARDDNPLGYEKVTKLILKFAIPAIISMVVSAFYNIVDQIFIGQGVGVLGNAATNVAFPVTTCSTALALMFGVGGAANYNLRSGEGRDEEARNYMGNAFLSLIICGVTLCVIVRIFLKPLLILFGSTDEIMPYATDYIGITAWGLAFLTLSTGGSHLIRADRSPRYSMTCTLVGAIINTILDPIFIFVCGWGIKGAAWATVIGQVVSGILVLVYFGKLSHVKLKSADLKLKPSNIGKIASLGMAASLNQIAIFFVQIVLNNVLRKYGAQSVYGAEIPIAVIGIVMKVNMIFLSICIGINQGCQPIIGFNYGAQKYDRVKETFRKSLIVCILIGVGFFLLFQLCPRTIISLFGSGSEEYIQCGIRFFRIFLLFTFINGVQPLASGFFANIGKAQLGVISSLTRQILFLIPLALIFPIFWGVDGVLYASPIADAAAFVITVYFCVKQFQDMTEKQKKYTAV